ncbi:MAG TPA: hypothetical protein VK550_26555 [Polyangiaceae bacterium]|nr:hypothetical protein [Polyangiaceae bacterium]
MGTTSFFRIKLTSVFAAALVVSTFACGDGPPSSPAARIYTGELTGTDVRLGIIATEHHARLFFCGGATTYETMTRWVTSDIDTAHKLSLPSSPTERWVLQGTVADAEVSGTIDMGDANSRPFHATAISERTISGLYEGTASCGRLGLIVVQATPDAKPTGQGACVGPVLEQVNPLEPIVRNPDGAIVVTIGSATAEREVRAAVPPPD